MSRTVFPSIIRSSRLYIQQQAYVRYWCLYSLELLMMDGKTVRNMYSKIEFEDMTDGEGKQVGRSTM